MSSRLLPSRGADSAILIEEYHAQRNEILQRAQSKAQTLFLTIASLGALLTVAYQNHIPALSLLHPILAVFLASTWSDDTFWIRKNATYIEHRIEARLGLDAQQRWRLGWEHYLKFEASRRRFLSRFFSLNEMASRGVFIGTSVAAILIGCSPLLSGGIIPIDVPDRVQSAFGPIVGSTVRSAVTDAGTLYFISVLLSSLFIGIIIFVILQRGAKAAIILPPERDVTAT